jgi:hypothetical protein
MMAVAVAVADELESLAPKEGRALDVTVGRPLGADRHEEGTDARKWKGLPAPGAETIAPCVFVRRGQSRWEGGDVDILAYE